MKPISLLAVAALGLSSVAGIAQMQADTPVPIVIETQVDMRTDPGPPADLHAAREEAINALHWAKTEGCRSDPSPRDCVRRAQEEYNQVMARLGRR